MCSVPEFAMVFDVESIGLHGEGYAVAWMVVRLSTGEVMTEGRASCPSDCARGFPDDRLWIRQHVDPHLPPSTHQAPIQVRRAFWNAWRSWAERSTHLIAHCGWPVEARFLADCIDD